MSEFRDEFRQVRREGTWAILSSIPAIVVIVIILGVVGFGVNMIFKPFQVIDKVTNPDRMIYTYEWFHDQYGRINAAEVQIDQKQSQINSFKETYGPAKDWKFATQTEYNTLSTELTGLKQHRATLIEEYNAASRNETRNFFKDGELPKIIH